MRESGRSYKQFEGLFKEQKRIKIRNIKTNLQIEAKLASIKTPLDRIYLHVYRQELFLHYHQLSTTYRAVK